MKLKNLIRECNYVQTFLIRLEDAKDQLDACIEAVDCCKDGRWNETGWSNGARDRLFVIREQLDGFLGTIVKHAFQLDKEVQIMVESLSRPNAGMGDGV